MNTVAPEITTLKRAEKWNGSDVVTGALAAAIALDAFVAKGNVGDLTYRNFKATKPVLALDWFNRVDQVSTGKAGYDTLFSPSFLVAVKSGKGAKLDNFFYANIRYDVYQGDDFVDDPLTEGNGRKKWVPKKATLPKLEIAGLDYKISKSDLNKIPEYRDGTIPMTDDGVTTLKVLNYLGRPPIPDEEILLMSNAEVIDLYYSLRQIVDICKVKPHEVISNGLSRRVFAKYEEDLQKRIYALRPDLHLVTSSDGKQYRALVEPKLLDPPDCPDNKVGTILSVLSFVPVIGLAAAAANAALSIKGALDAQAMAKKYGKIGAEVGIGTATARLMPDRTYDQATIDSLKSKYLSWKQAYETLSPLFDSLYSRIDTVYGIERMLGSELIVGNSSAKVSLWRTGNNGIKVARTYKAADYHWRLADFFVSAKARYLVTGEGAPAGDGIDLATAGIGIGALLLLLL